MCNIFSPFRLILLFVTVGLLSLALVPHLKVRLKPIAQNMQLQVSFSLPGSSPENVERYVTSILENAVSKLTQLKRITSVSNYNGGVITLLFDKKTNLQMKAFEAASVIRQIYPDLPPNCSYPVIQSDYETKSLKKPLLIYTINSPKPSFEIRKEAEDILNRLFAGFSGIRDIRISGSSGLQVSISFNYDLCRSLKIQPSEITSSLQSYTSEKYPGTYINSRNDQIFLHIPGNAMTPEGIKNLIVSTSSSRTIRLRDIARVYIEEQKLEAYSRINGKNSVSVSLFAKEDQNNILLSRNINNLIIQSRSLFPDNYTILKEYDEGEFISKEIYKCLRRSFVSLAILVLFIFVITRSWKHSLVLILGLLINIAFIIILTWALDINIHIYTISGLAISFGLVLDNAIVMVDYLRYSSRNKVFPSLLGATLVTISSLSLVYYLPEPLSGNLKEFAEIICVSLISSLFISYGLLPNLYLVIIFLKNRRRSSRSTRVMAPGLFCRYYYRFMQLVAGHRKLFVAFVILSFGIPLFLLPPKWEGDSWYNHVYNASFGSESYRKKFKPSVDNYLGGALFYFSNNSLKGSYFKDIEKTRLYIDAELPYGNTPAQMNKILASFETYLRNVRGIDKYITNVYSGQHGEIEIIPDEDREKGDFPYALKAQLIKHSLNMNGVSWDIYGIGRGFSNESIEKKPDFKIAIRGYNYAEVCRQIQIITEKLLRNKRIPKINSNEQVHSNEKLNQEYVIMLNPGAMAFAGTNRLETSNQLAEFAPSREKSMLLEIDSLSLPVSIKENNSDEMSYFDLLNHPLSIDSIHTVQLKDFSNLALHTISSALNRENRQYIRIIGFEYLGAMALGGRYVESVLKEMKEQMPLGYTARGISNYRNPDDSDSIYYILLLVAILMSFVICSITFENLRQSLLIICLIPISFIGIFLTYPLFDVNFDQGGYAAFVLLGGLVVNSSIFIVNDFNRIRKQRPFFDPNKLLIKVISRRKRTILLTTLSSICGLLPFLLESTREVFWFALAAGTIGGLVFSVLTLFIVFPVFLWKNNTTR